MMFVLAFILGLATAIVLPAVDKATASAEPSSSHKRWEDCSRPPSWWSSSQPNFSAKTL